MVPGFTLAAAGDCVITNSLGPMTYLEPLRQLLCASDVAFANLETSLLDPSQVSVAPCSDLGCGWAIAPPSVALNLRDLGFNLLARANNHAVDFGPDGICWTGVALDEAGLVHAGAGRDRPRAAAPRYFHSPKGRVALVSAASTYAPMSRAQGPAGLVPGRPGVNVLRTTQYLHITREQLQTLRGIRDSQPGAAAVNPEYDPSDVVELFGTQYKADGTTGTSYITHPADENQILESVSEAKSKADFVVFSMHAHEPGNWSELPADFLPAFLRKVIDAGAGVVIGHGPHRLRGIELYRGCPIFYSLGNFIFQLEARALISADLFAQYQADMGATEAELNALCMALSFTDTVWRESMIATVHFEDGRAAEIRLIPIELAGINERSRLGLPRLASMPTAKTILERVRDLSRPFGTRICVEGITGVIRQSSPGIGPASDQFV